jgi:ABC-type nitrate/sulfonate/bicarbonate transport system ATPase subunit
VSIGLKSRTGSQPSHSPAPDVIALSGVRHTYPARDGRGPSGRHSHSAGGSALALADGSLPTLADGSLPTLADGSVPALADVSLRVGVGELAAVVGPSGCGKTTLLELICGLRRPDAGSVQSAPAALMPQHDLLLPWLSAVDNAALALRIARRPRGWARARAQAMFAELGLEGFEAARPYELSGGMRQRVAFVRTLLSGKPVLCLDEPFGALDAITRAEMQGWLGRALQRDRSKIGQRTVVLVTHDVEEAVLLADRVVVLSPRPGRTVAEIEIGLPRPRARTNAAVIALREQALIALGLGTSPDGPPRQAPPAATDRLGHDSGSEGKRWPR